MKKIKSVIILSAFVSSSFSFAALPEISGKITFENSKYTSSGINIGESKAPGSGLGSDTTHNKETFKREASARIYFDGQAGEESNYHVELQAFNDDKAVGNFGNSEEYTQRDPLREAYVDTSFNDWMIRAGKQQVVWGTADGMKLLDSINPTDYSEMVQNQMEDSRIPVWMLNADTQLEDGGNFQFIVSQPKENIFAGLNRNISTHLRTNGSSTDLIAAKSGEHTTGPGHDQGNPFIMKGVDSITGKTNGFLNIVPDLATVAQRFYSEFSSTGAASLASNQSTTVNAFAKMSSSQVNANFAPSARGYNNINAFANVYGWDGAQILGGFAGGYDTNLNNNNNALDFGVVKDSVFEYMGNTTFGTFDAMANGRSKYVFDMPEDDVDVSMRYKNTTADGTNYSFNYSYAYDKNPIIDIDWKNANGETLTTTRTANSTYGTTTLTLADSNGKRYGAYAGGSGTKSTVDNGVPVLHFTQKVKRIHNIGGSFDTSFETNLLGPIVIRGEALYQKDTYSPVMDMTALSIGDLPAALKMEKGDRFKYVLGVDITALTNMMVSLQFIQDKNLDYIDTTSTINAYSDKKFTTDYATMHMTNGFNKAEKDKDFYSLYLSKPFGYSGQHRWNNILILEENNGYWNRLDAEYTIDDNTVATVEYNKYWGNENTQFGQLDKASNIQVGLKYSF